MSIALVQLLRHSGAKPRKGNRGIACDSAGWFKTSDILAVKAEDWKGQLMDLELLLNLVAWNPSRDFKWQSKWCLVPKRVRKKTLVPLGARVHPRVPISARGLGLVAVRSRL